MTPRTQIQLGVFGCTHQAESVITLLNGGSRSLSREALAVAVAEAQTTAARLVRDLDNLADEIERQRSSEWEARWSGVASKEGAAA